MGMWKIVSVLCAGMFFVIWMACPVLAEDTSIQNDELSSYTNDDSSGDQMVEPGSSSPSFSGNLIDGSISRNHGIISVNQSSGGLNNQSNLRTFGFGSDLGVMEESRSNISIKTEGNRIEIPETTRIDAISESVTSNIGVIGINQAAGNCNQQSNVLVMTLGEGVLNEAELNSVASGQENDIPDLQGDRLDYINSSFANTRGVVQVTQSAGDGNIIGNRMAISFSSGVIK